MSGVVLGAFGAHGLKSVLQPDQLHLLDTWDTGVLYQLTHAVVIVSIGLSAQTSKLFRWVVILMTVGVIMFSGSLYGLVLDGPRWLGPITPLGGTCFIVGWSLLMVAAWRR